MKQYNVILKVLSDFALEVWLGICIYMCTLYTYMDTYMYVTLHVGIMI